MRMRDARTKGKMTFRTEHRSIESYARALEDAGLVIEANHGAKA
jgi:hypothetical protein